MQMQDLLYERSMLTLISVSFDRDTPHHLKNKRVQQGLLTDKAANLIISNALKQQEMNLKSVENIIPEDAEKDEHAVESGKLLRK